MKQLPILGTLWLMMTACATPPAGPTFAFTVPAGSTLVLQQPVEVPAYRGRAYIQGGKVIRFSKQDQYKPYCRLELRNVPETTFWVEPQTLEIYRVYREVEEVSVDRVRLASLTTMLVSDGGGSSVMTTVFSLRSARQPNIQRLVCEHWEDATEAEHLTLDQVHKVLGEIGMLKVLE